MKNKMKNKKIITVTALLCGSAMLTAQSLNQNHIITTTYTKDDGNTALTKTEYFNGLGYPVQTVLNGISPERKDMVSLIEYDNLNRKAKTWLPAEGTGSGDYTAPATVKQNAIDFYGDSNPYSKPVYDGSPLNRVTERYGVGQEWHTGKKSVKVVRKTNVAQDGSVFNCVKYTVSGDKLVKSGNYSAGELLVIETTDEDGAKLYKFTDKTGQTLLVRLVNNGVNHDTYYVYDKYGNRCFVLPPLVEDNISAENLKKYAYIYKYDNYNRMISKKMPGCEPVEYVYDKADRLIFWQDGEMREKEKWMFSISDNFGRTVLTGICDENALGLKISNNNFNSVLVKAKKRTNFAAGIFGYDIMKNGSAVSTANLAGMKALTVNWFDDYNFLNWESGLNNASKGIKYNEEAGYDKMYGDTDTPPANKGLLTGTATAMLENDDYLYSALYYDWAGRIIQTKSTNHLGGLELEYIEYNFAGNPVKKQHYHTANGTSFIKEVYKYSYDHAGRLKNVTLSINNNDFFTTITANDYDEIGRLHSTSNITDEPVLYSYDVRSRLKTIDSKEFAQQLEYYPGGNILSSKWRNGTGNGYTDGYNFEYDQLSRLTKANYDNLVTGVNGAYNEEFEYDKHGNIEKLKRYTQGSGFKSGIILADDLEMEYEGNQLFKVVDKAPYKPAKSDEYFFTKWTQTSLNSYAHNANGAMIKDDNKGMDVEYNILNLPKTVKINNSVVLSGSIAYNYSADGAKRKVAYRWLVPAVVKPEVSIEPDPGVFAPYPDKSGEEDNDPKNGGFPNGSYTTKTKTTDYVGNKIYEDGKLDKILFGNGYVKDKNYYFYLKDHLGSARVVMKREFVSIQGPCTPEEEEQDPEEEGEAPPPRGNKYTVMQRVNYYPSGLMMSNGLNHEAQNFLYTSHEWDNMHGINWLDAGARFLNNALIRWIVPDPKAEKYFQWSPYVYCLNNPVKYIDPDGKQVINPQGHVINNQNIIDALAMLNQLIINHTGLANKDFTLHITGGDRIRLGKDKDGNPHHWALRDGSRVKESDKNSPHAIQRGAIGVDFCITNDGNGKVTKALIKELYKAAGFTYHKDDYKNTNHIHLSLPASMAQDGLKWNSRNIPTSSDFNMIHITLGEVTVTAPNLYEAILEARAEMLKNMLNELEKKMRAIEQSQADSELDEIKFWQMQKLIRQAEEIRKKGEPIEKAY